MPIYFPHIRIDLERTHSRLFRMSVRRRKTMRVVSGRLGLACAILAGLLSSPASAAKDAALLKRAMARCQQRIDSVKSFKGTVLVFTQEIKNGILVESKRKITVACDGKYCKVSSKPIFGKSLEYEGVSDGVTITQYVKDEDPSVRIHPFGCYATSADMDMYLDPRKTAMIYTANKGEIKVKVVGKQKLNGDDCVIVEWLTPFDVCGQKYYSTLRCWVDTDKGFTVPLRKWLEISCSDGNATSGTYIFADVKKYGHGLWGPAKVRKDHWEKGGRGHDIVTYCPGFALNVPVSVEELTLKLPSGTKVHDETTGNTYTTP